MRFTEQELIFFNSITGGGELFGFPLRFLDKGERQDMVRDTFRTLAGKGMLEFAEEAGEDIEREMKLTEKGGSYARALKQYRESERYVIMNYLHAALVDPDTVILLYQADGEYELYAVPSSILTYIVLRRWPNHTNETNQEMNPSYVRMHPEEVLKQISGSDDSVTFGYFCGKKAEESIYYLLGRYWYKYDFSKQERLQMREKEIKTELAKKLASVYGR